MLSQIALLFARRSDTLLAERHVAGLAAAPVAPRDADAAPVRAQPATVETIALAA